MGDFKEYFPWFCLFVCFFCILGRRKLCFSSFIMKSTSSYFRKVPNLPGIGCSFFFSQSTSKILSLIASLPFPFVFFAALIAENLIFFLISLHLWKKCKINLTFDIAYLSKQVTKSHAIFSVQSKTSLLYPSSSLSVEYGFTQVSFSETSRTTEM